MKFLDEKIYFTRRVKMEGDNNEQGNLVEIWEDHVDIKDLLIAMILCVGFSLGGYLLAFGGTPPLIFGLDRKSTRLNSSHVAISYAVFCLKKKKKLYMYI